MIIFLKSNEQRFCSLLFCNKVTIDTISERNKVCVEVSDNGLGRTEKQANSFQQAETSRNQMESRLHLIKSSHLRYALRWGSITLKPFKD